MGTLLIATAATVVATAALVLALRARRAGEHRVTEVVSHIDNRLETMIRDLSAAVEHAQEESRRAHVLGALTASIELDEVVAATLDAAFGLAHVDAATLTLEL